MSKYFDRFPTIDYDGSIARNILAKVDFTEQTKRDIYSSFDFTLTDGVERSDLLSDATYNSPEYDWLIYLANDVIDPYYDYYIGQQKFSNYITTKYGTYANASSQILYYRNNWAPADGQISTTAFNALTNNMQKYYKPVLNINNQVTGYTRIQEDWIISTNKIMDIYVANTSEFSEGERITQSSSSAQASIIKVDSANNVLTVQHVFGTFANGALGNTTISNTALLQQSIPDDEAPFWAPVTALESEEEENELKKYITLIKSSYLPDVDKLFREQIRR